MERLAPLVEPNLHVSDKYADELADSLLELVNINDVQSVVTDAEVEMQLNEIKSNHKCLSRYVSFPSPSKQISQTSSSDEEESTESLVNFPSQQVPVKLKSAMKGGTSPRNKTVSWAPDVYDPPPTSLSHSIRRGSRHQRLSKKDKRRGKRSQHTHKGKDLSKSSRERKKKPISPTNLSRSAIMSFKLDDVGDDLGIMSEENNVESFGFGGSDNSCGSSFFKVSLSNAQYPVAEAL